MGSSVKTAFHFRLASIGFPSASESLERKNGEGPRQEGCQDPDEKGSKKECCQKAGGSGKEGTSKEDSSKEAKGKEASISKEGQKASSKEGKEASTKKVKKPKKAKKPVPKKVKKPKRKKG